MVSSPSPSGTTLIPNEAHGLNRNRIILLLSALYFGVMLAALDTTVVTTLLGHIASDLEALDSVSWVATGYTVAYSAFQPLYGKFSDIWGRKTVSIYCTFFFGLGCLMCGFAPGLAMLVAGRFVSGFGAGGMLSMSTVIVSDYVPLRSRGVFQGIGNVAFGTGASLGGLLGGWVTSIAGWRGAFNVQVPLAALSILAQIWLLHENPKSGGAANLSATAAQSKWKRIDWVGSFSLVSALLLSMLAITTGGNQFAWASWPILLLFICSILLLWLFYHWETHVAIEPVMPIDVIMHRTVISACLTNFFGSGLAYAFLYYSPIFLQAMCHYTYTEIGHRVVANFVGVATGSLGAGLIMRRTGKYYVLALVCGLLTILASSSLFVSPLLGTRVSHSAVYQSLSYALNGLGYSGMLTVTLLALIAAVEPHQQALSTAAQYTFRGAGSSLGIASAAAVFQNVLGYNLVSKIGDDTPQKRKIIEAVSKSLEAIWEQPKLYQKAIVKSYVAAGMAVQGFCVLWGVLSFLSSACMQEHDLERTPTGSNSNDSETRPLRNTTPPGPLDYE